MPLQFGPNRKWFESESSRCWWNGLGHKQKMFILKSWTAIIKQSTADVNSPALMQTHDLEKLLRSQPCVCWNDSSGYKVTTPQVIKWHQNTLGWEIATSGSQTFRKKLLIFKVFFHSFIMFIAILFSDHFRQKCRQFRYLWVVKSYSQFSEKLYQLKTQH